MTIAMAMIPLSRGGSLSPDAVEAALAEHWPDLPPLAEATTHEADGFSFRLGTHDVAVIRAPFPIPWSDLEGPCEASWLWPDAAESLKESQESHVVVTVSGRDARPVELWRTLTQACASILTTTPTALGVLWSPSMLLVPAPIFRDFAVEVLPEGPPLPIWIDTRIGRAAGDKLAGFTIGLQALGLMELETDDFSGEPGVLRDRLYALATYQIENGPVIRDGDTIGDGGADGEIRVVHAESLFGHDGKVMRLLFTPAAGLGFIRR